MPNVLTLNGGSSSIRFACYAASDCVNKLLDGKIERIGVAGTTLDVKAHAHGQSEPRQTKTAIDAADHRSAVDFLMNWFGTQPLLADLAAVGHRIVHGMQHSNPERVTPALLAELKRITPYDPEHLPREIDLIEAVDRKYPTVPQVACFDTAFHRTMPRVATIIPIPRHYESQGVQRYGFHGLSYTYLLGELGRVSGAAAAHGRVIFAHLGNGASLAAVRDGACIDTSMGFTPTAGVVMSTRSGDLDPGVMSYLALSDAMDAPTFQSMVNHRSGLLGVSETSSDIRDLLASAGDDVRAAEAVALFCYQIKKFIGAFAAALGGVDTMVFAGGIGENAASIRATICEGLGFLGIELDAARNGANAAVISMESARVAVRVIPTDEESVIASSALRVLGLAST